MSGRHLSGAEDLVPAEELEQTVAAFLKRLAPFASREKQWVPQQILTIDPIPEKAVLRKPLLPVQMLDSKSLEETSALLPYLLEELLPNPMMGEKILEIFFREIMDSPPKNGALVVTTSGELLDMGNLEGIRTTHVGCTARIRQDLEQCLDPLTRPNYRLVDALVLASKVISSGCVLLEICASDDPEYTTGYLASDKFGYIRIPHIKTKGSGRGGRLYVVPPDVDLRSLITYLRATPVVIDRQPSPAESPLHPSLKTTRLVPSTNPCKD